MTATLAADLGLADTFDPALVAWVFTIDDLLNLGQAIRTAIEVVPDLETTGLDEHAYTGGPWNGGVGARVVCASFTLPQPDDTGEPVTWLLPLSHPESPWIGKWRTVLAKVFQLIVDLDKPVNNQHVKFDSRWVYATTRQHVDLSGCIAWDTQISSHLLDENVSTKLKERAPATFGIKRWDDFDLTTPGAAERVPLIDLGLYAARDTYWTWRLGKLHRQQMFLEPDSDGERREPTDTEEIEHARLGKLAVWVAMPTTATLAAIEQRGMLLDRKWVADRIAENSAELTVLHADLSTRYETSHGLKAEDASFAPTALWFLSWAQAAVDNGDLRIAGLTPQGRPTWGKAVLIRQARAGSEVAQNLLDHRQRSKRLEFLNSWLGHAKRDGRIHASYNAGSVVTGRLSSCVTADTLIDMPRDMVKYPHGVPITEVRAGDWVYSFDWRRELTLRQVEWVGQTGVKATVVVTFENSEGHQRVLRCTPEHLVRLRNGDWRPAGSLLTSNGRGEQANPRVMAMVRRGFDSDKGAGYLHFFPHSVARGEGMSGGGRSKEHRWVVEQILGKRLSTKLDVHHRNGTKIDNTPSNLIDLTMSEHRALGHTHARYGEVRESPEMYLGPNDYRVISVEPGPTEPVWDMTVPVDHQFVANGIVVHNSNPNMQQVTSALKAAFIPTPGYVIADFDYCLEGSMRVLTPELEWVAVSDLKPGQKLIGFPEHVGLGAGRTNRYEETEVVSTKKLRRPSRVVMLSDGRAVACSAEHRWLSFEQGTSGRRVWVEAQNLKPGDIIPALTEPWDEPQTLQEVKDIAYLQGFLDGEGWVTETGMGWGQLPGLVHDEVLAVSERLGIEWVQSSHMNNGVIQHRVGSMARTLNILGRVRPHRLLPKARQAWDGRQTYGKSNTGVIVVEVIDAGEQDVIAVETTTKTLIVEGLLSHNSQIELRVAAFISRCVPMIEAYLRGDDLHKLMAARITGKPVSEILPAERQAGKCFHPDTEVLSQTRGWVRIIDLQPGEMIAQGLPGESGRMGLSWVVPCQVYTMENEHDHLIHLRNEGMDLTVTPDHGLLALTASGKWERRLPEAMPGARHWYNAGEMSASWWCADPVLLRVAVMVQADGSYAHRKVVLGFTKKRKIQRCRELLSAAGIEFTEMVKANGATTFRFYSDGVRALLDPDKTLPWRWLGLPPEQRSLVIAEARHWDGTKAGNWKMHQYLSSRQKNRDVMQALAAVTGRKTRDDGQDKLTVRAIGSARTRGGNLSVEKVPYTGTVACLAVESGVVLVRSGGVTSVTYQSANFGLLYGMSPMGFLEYAETVYGVTFTAEEAVAVHAAFFQLWEGLAAWHAKAISRAHRTGQVVSPIGRIRRLPMIYDRNDKVVGYAERAAINSPVQGFASDLMQTAAASIEGKLPGHSAVPGVRLVGTVHDSIVAELPEDRWEEAAHACIDRMINIPQVLRKLDCHFDIPLGAEAKIGTRWGFKDLGLIEV